LVYAALVAVRNAELQAHWTRYNIQSVLNLGFALAVLGAQPSSFIGEHQMLFAIAGALLGGTWLWFAWESKNVLVNRWGRHLKQFEEEHRDRLAYRLFTLVAAEEEGLGPLTLVQRLLPVGFIIVWLGYLAWLAWSTSASNMPLPRMSGAGGASC
jgi:hypothetical protein